MQFTYPLTCIIQVANNIYFFTGIYQLCENESNSALYRGEVHNIT